MTTITLHLLSSALNFLTLHRVCMSCRVWACAHIIRFSRRTYNVNTKCEANFDSYHVFTFISPFLSPLPLLFVVRSNDQYGAMVVTVLQNVKAASIFLMDRPSALVPMHYRRWRLSYYVSLCPSFCKYYMRFLPWLYSVCGYLLKHTIIRYIHRSLFSVVSKDDELYEWFLWLVAWISLTLLLLRFDFES